MKKSILTAFFMLCAASAVHAIKPLETKGFDMYKNSVKVDWVSIGYLSPQVAWEHYTNTRFSFGVSAQAHFVNRSSFVRSFSGEEPPATVELDGQTYNLDWLDHPSKWYADVTMDGKTYEVKWDRKYVGLMVCPEGRFYFGSKPARGFYAAARVDLGIFREMFDVSVETLDKEYRRSLTDDQKKTDEKYLEFQEDSWRKAGSETGEIDLGLGAGFGLGYQLWFGRNGQWGMDANCFVKSDWKIGEDENVWEWFWGVGLPADLNLSLIYRF